MLSVWLVLRTTRDDQCEILRAAKYKRMGTIVFVLLVLTRASFVANPLTPTRIMRSENDLS